MNDSGHILIADDEEVFLQTTATLLRRKGYTCTCAPDATTVLKLLEQETFDLLISDIKMPGNPQLELVEQWLRLADGVPVILITAYPSVESAIRAIQLPVVAYLVKPFEFHALLAEVRSALARMSTYRAAQEAQQRWQDWKLEREHDAGAMQSRLRSRPEGTAGMFLNSLRSLVDCVTDLRELKDVLLEERARHDSPPAQSEKNSARQTVPTNDREFHEVNASSGQIPSKLMGALQQLSRREREVLRLLLDHQRLQTIAKTLYISPHTARNHLHAVFRKLSVHSQPELLKHLEPYREIKAWL